MVEQKFNWFFRLIKHPLFILCVSLLIGGGYLQKCSTNQSKRYEIFKRIPSLHAEYYQEIWNEWYAFRDKTPLGEYRRNIQRITAESKTIGVQLPLLFKDKKVYENWKKFLHIYWEARYPISREGISEQQLNEKLNSAAPFIDDILNRMYKEIK